MYLFHMILQYYIICCLLSECEESLFIELSRVTNEAVGNICWEVSTLIILVLTYPAHLLADCGGGGSSESADAGQMFVL